MAKRPRSYERGVTLVELMVGMTIGLLVVAVAGAALMASRGISGTVSDAASIQQQAAYVLRVLGNQLRQAGSTYLDLNSDDPFDDVILKRKIEGEETESHNGDDPQKGKTFNRDDEKTILFENDNELFIGYSRYSDSFEHKEDILTASNCLGHSGRPGDARIESIFSYDPDSHVLRCRDAAGVRQPIADNVADFQIRYVIQGGAQHKPDMSYGVKAEDISDWTRIKGIEICLVLYGHQSASIPAGSTYTGCDGNPVDMTTLADGRRRNRMHLVFRNVFQLRNMG